MKQTLQEQLELLAESCETEHAPLYMRYRGQAWPQPAYLELRGDGELRISYTRDWAGAVPVPVWTGAWRRWALPPDTSGEALADWLRREDVAMLVAATLAGLDVHWDGHNMVGLLDEASSDAEQELQRLADELDCEDCRALISKPSDYIRDARLADIWPAGQTLAEAAAALEADATSNGYTLDTADEDMLSALRARAEHEIELWPERVAPHHLAGLLKAQATA